MSLGKQLLILCFLAALGYGGYEGWQRYGLSPQVAEAPRAPKPIIVETAPSERRSMARTIEAVGTTRARQSVSIVPVDDGRVTDLAISPGQSVVAGEVLVRMEDAIQRADLAEAEARVTERSQALERVQTLLSSNAVSQATLEDTTARLAEARAQLDRARERLANRTITAPFDGHVGLSEIDPGAWIKSGDKITTLDDLSDVIVEFSLPETLFADVRPGQQVTARSAAFPGRDFTGRIAAVDSRIDPVARAFRTRAIIPNPENLLPAGMFMSMTLTLSEAERTVVPEAAIVFQAAETYVFVANGDTAQRVSVTTGQRRDGVVSILSGLEPGQHVIIHGLQRVRDGGPIKRLEPEKDAAATSGSDG